ncbi:MAG: prenyltransferase/squalene oxidase repeat-containing protein [Planctomycetota bacterium]|nr:prenyltransferase/squalene oxidase repeat-containing protein [Planctomycetota bacterium]
MPRTRRALVQRLVRTVALLFTAIASLEGLSAAAQEPAHATQAQIDDAIDRGATYLLTRQELDGSWKPNEHRYVSGQTGLSIYTLLKAGIPRSHPSIQRGIGFLRAHPPRWTYGIACCILALHEADPELYRAEIEEWIEALLEAHGRGFSYPGLHEDLSLTQYGCLALRVAEKMEIGVNPKVWKALLDYGMDLQHENGAFTYRPGSPRTGSMTAAGIAVVHIARDALTAANKLGPREERASTAAIDRGVDWLGQHMVVDHNPDPDEENKNAGHIQRWRLYYLYGLERVGGLTGRDLFGTRDWYQEAADFLVRTQKDDGAWSTVYGEEHPGTCFGVLVLRRATAPTSGSRPPIARAYGGDDPALGASMRATGDTPLTLWISSVGDEVRETHEWDDERSKGLRVWRVEYFDADTNEVLAAVPGDPEAPHGAKRFAAQVRMTRPGRYKIGARLLVRPIDDVDDEEVPILTQTIEADVRAIYTPEQKLYQAEFGQSVLTNTSVKIRASSESGGRSAAQAADGLTCYGWACAKEDTKPWIEFEPRRPQRATVIALTPIWRQPDQPTHWDLPTKVHLFLNGKNRGVHDVDLSNGGKAYIELDKRTTIRSMRLEIVERGGGTHAPDRGTVGFGEVELVLRAAKKKSGRR